MNFETTIIVKMKSLLALVSVVFGVVQAYNSLTGAKVYEVLPKTQKDRLIVQGLQIQIEGLDFWQHSHVAGRPARIMVPKSCQKFFETTLNWANISHNVTITDVKSVIEDEVIENEKARRLIVPGQISFEAFHRHEEINSYLDGLAVRHPNLVTVETAGKTPLGRAIKLIKISTTGFKDVRKPVIVVDAAIHAREWAAPAVALYMITKLVEDVTESDVAQNIDWIIFPVLNPDGYEYTHTNYRLWRKTRSTASSTTCPGVDGNRNFNFHWMGAGTSSNPCSDIFAGPSAFSEIEASVLRDVLLGEFNERIKAYFAIHSHGSYLLYPYGFDGSDPPNVDELHTLGTEAARAIDSLKAPGAENYLVGNAGTALNYFAAGASDDWARGVAGIGITYTFELPGGGSTGFELPPSRIRQVVTETWAGILVIARYVLDASTPKQ